MSLSFIERTIRRRIHRLLGVRRRSIHFVKYRLWHGFSKPALDELEEMLRNPRTHPWKRSAVAFQIARWHCGRREFAKAHHYLKEVDRTYIGGREGDRAVTMIEAEVLGAVGTQTEKRKFLHTFKENHDLSLALAFANLSRETAESDPELDPLAVLNRSYAQHGLATIEKIRQDEPLGIDNLTGSESRGRARDASALVSIIMPAWRAASTIETAMRGIAEQSYANLDVIVVDDASSDGTADLVNDFAARDSRFRLIRSRENIGAYSCRNLGLSEARGDLVTVHDADDWSHPDKIAVQVEHLKKTQAPYNLAMWVRADNELFFRGNDVYSGRFLGPDHSSAMFHRDVLEESRGWDRVRISADTELMWRIENRFGNSGDHIKRRRVLENCPLAIGRIENNSLTRQSSTHISTIRFGVRREYRDAAAHWHRRIRKGQEPERGPEGGTFFPVPAFIRYDTARPSKSNSLIIGDFRGKNAPGGIFRLLQQVCERKRGPCAIFHYPDYETADEFNLPPFVREYAWQNDVRIIVAGESLEVETTFIPDIRLLRYALDNPPAVSTNLAKIVRTADVQNDKPQRNLPLQSLLKNGSVSAEARIETYASMEELVSSVAG